MSNIFQKRISKKLQDMKDMKNIIETMTDDIIPEDIENDLVYDHEDEIDDCECDEDDIDLVRESDPEYEEDDDEDEDDD